MSSVGSIPFDPATIWPQNRSREIVQNALQCRGDLYRGLESESSGLTVCKLIPGADLRSLLARAPFSN